MSPFIGFCRDLKEHPALPAAIFTFAWLEGVMEAKLCRFSEEPDWHNLQEWPAGRLFGEQGEYRWQRNPAGGIHAVLLLDSGEPPDWFNEPPCLLTEPQETQLILWGEQDNNIQPDEPDSTAFYAPELPRAQSYPLDPEEGKGKRACLLTRRYQGMGGQGEFERCVAVRRYREGGRR